MNKERIKQLAYELILELNKGYVDGSDDDFIDEVIEAIKYNEGYRLVDL